MQKVLIVCLSSLLLFVLSAAASYYMKHWQEQEGVQRGVTPVAARAPKAAPIDEPVPEKPKMPPSPEDPFQEDPADGPRPASRFRREKEEARQKIIEMILNDIKTERGIIDKERERASVLMLELREKAAQVEHNTAQLTILQNGLVQKVEDINKKFIQYTQVEDHNIKVQQEHLGDMEPMLAARILVEMIEKRHDLETAAKLLSNMQHRKGASILGEISKTKPALADQLLEKWLGLKPRPVKPATFSSDY